MILYGKLSVLIVPVINCLGDQKPRLSIIQNNYHDYYYLSFFGLHLIDIPVTKIAKINIKVGVNMKLRGLTKG